ncbi:MAG TPA: hypothetical protein VLA20_05300 [Vicinamibacterales bacterium]|nr:hypothetical protein [Vicinamibacterales bacterium]
MYASLFSLVVLAFVGVIALVIVVAVRTWRDVREKARQAGYATVGAFLRAAPQTDEEKRDAVDMALKGLVISALGLLFPPFLLIGLFPLFYGARKLAYASMGLGLVDDAERPGA